MNTRLSTICALTAGLLCACQPPAPATIEGHLQGITADSVYLYKVTNVHYNGVEYLQALPTTDGRFSYPADSLQKGLYCLALENTRNKEYLQQYAQLFLEPAPLQIELAKDKYGKLTAQVTGSELQTRYATFQADLYRAENRATTDSLDALFYAAREENNREEMERIRTVSSPYYEQGRKQAAELIDKEIEKNKGTYFGLWLYNAYRFQNHTFNTMEEIEEARRFADSSDEESKQSDVYAGMMETLDRSARCAVGSMAPEITGHTTDGKDMSLSSLKGKYVLVDFWFSGCGWCRKENPYLQRAYNDFKKKNFTILGVSVDRREEDWKKAIEEDKSYWNQIRVAGEEAKRMNSDYCIVGYPHIILVDPAGKIVAKELRGDELYNTVKSFVNGEK